VRGLLVRAVAGGAVFLVAHAAGWRAYASVLCGTFPGDAVSRGAAALMGAVYVLAYAWATALSPALGIAAGVLCACRALAGRR
jgi:hypothetical protein